MTTGWQTIDVQVAWTDDPLTISPTWTSIISDVIDIQTDRGTPLLQRFADTGTLAVTVDDTSGTYNQLNAAGAHYSALSSGNLLQFRVIANNSGSTTKTVFRGHMKPRGLRNNPQLPGTATAVFSCADIFQMCARFKLAKLDLPDAGGVSLSDTFDALLLTAGLPAAWGQFVAPGGAGEGVIRGPSVFGDSLLGYLQTLALSDGGYVYGDQNGLLTLEQRLNSFYASTRTTVQKTFADDGTSGAVKFESDSIALDYAEDTFTEARYTGTTGNPQDIVAAVPGITGVPNVDEQTILARDDPEAYARAELSLALHTPATYGPISLTFEACESTDAFDAMCNLDLRHRVKVKYTPPGLSNVALDMFVQRIAIDIPVEASPNTAKVRLGLTPCAPFDALNGGTFLILNDATKGKLNTATLAY